MVKEKTLNLSTKNGLTVHKFRDLMKTLMNNGEMLLDIIVDLTSSYQTKVLSRFTWPMTTWTFMTAGQMLFTFELIMELLITYGYSDL